MKVSDVIMGPFFAVLGVIIMYAASTQPKPFFGNGYGGGHFPAVIGAGLILGGILLALNGWRERGLQPLIEAGDWIRSPRHIGNVIVVIAALLFYIAFSNYLGFVIAGFIVAFATLLQFTRRLGPSLGVAAATVLIIKIGFQDLLMVPLPWGVLTPLSGVLSWR